MKTFSFSVPITESMDEPAAAEMPMRIKGEAIHAIITRNKTKFTEEELKPSAKTLSGRPLLKDHNNSVDSVVGKVSEAAYDDKGRCVSFKADVMDPAMCQKIKQGLVNAVSVGAACDLMPELDEKTGDVTCYAAKNITFLELSLVAIPADPDAGFERAIAESFKFSEDEPLITPRESAEPVVTEHDAQLAKQREEEAATMAEEQNKIDALRAESAKLQEEIETMKLEKLRAEKAALEAAAKPVQTETKGKIATEAPAPSVTLQMSELGGQALEASYEGRDNLTWKVK